jgi:hypothetical protein
MQQLLAVQGMSSLLFKLEGPWSATAYDLKDNCPGKAACI